MPHLNLNELLTIWNDNPSRHTLIEDVQGIAFGAIVASLGLFFLNQAGLLTGGTAGLAFLVHYTSGFSLGSLFFLVNLPFYFLSWRRVGKVFTIKTFVAIALTSLLTDVQSRFLHISDINALWSAFLGGLLLGFGLLALYRHRASLGGVGILGVYLQEKTGFRAGLTQMIFDGIILVIALLLLDPRVVMASVIGAVTMNMFVAINHRADRYIAIR
ncbi:YitT family protein [Rhizobium sp. L1K21]|nr:YitT family protein [Rhizobium sp. L1K21]MCO6187173.1 YitT family protein [Rhizobium sp. L1K21]